MSTTIFDVIKLLELKLLQVYNRGGDNPFRF